MAIWIWKEIISCGLFSNTVALVCQYARPHSEVGMGVMDSSHQKDSKYWFKHVSTEPLRTGAGKLNPEISLGSSVSS